MTFWSLGDQLLSDHVLEGEKEDKMRGKRVSKLLNRCETFDIFAGMLYRLLNIIDLWRFFIIKHLFITLVTSNISCWKNKNEDWDLHDKLIITNLLFMPLMIIQLIILFSLFWFLFLPSPHTEMKAPTKTAMAPAVTKTPPRMHSYRKTWYSPLPVPPPRTTTNSLHPTHHHPCADTNSASAVRPTIWCRCREAIIAISQMAVRWRWMQGIRVEEQEEGRTLANAGNRPRYHVPCRVVPGEGGTFRAVPR